MNCGGVDGCSRDTPPRASIFKVHASTLVAQGARPCVRNRFRGENAAASMLVVEICSDEVGVDKQ